MITSDTQPSNLNLRDRTIRPVFIGGCDRSGTTMLGAMLGTHNHCLCVPESQFIIDSLSSSSSHPGNVELHKVWQAIKQHPRFLLWHLEIANPLVERPDTKQTTFSNLIEKIVQVYGKQAGKEAFHIWIDHTPTNTKHFATLQYIFQDAKLLHIVRDGRAVAASILPLNWGPNTIDKAAYFWLRNLSYGLAAESYFSPDSVKRVKYENLVAMPEETLQKICTFIGITYHPQMVFGSGFQLPAYTQNQHALVGKRPDAGRINAWEQKLTTREIEIFENIAGDALQYLGYKPLYGSTARPMNQNERIVSTLRTVGMYWGNLLNEIAIRRSTQRETVITDSRQVSE